jgi:hypothetical protein
MFFLGALDSTRELVVTSFLSSQVWYVSSYLGVDQTLRIFKNKSAMIILK